MISNDYALLYEGIRQAIQGKMLSTFQGIDTEEILKEDILHQFETPEPKALNNNLIYSLYGTLKTNSKLNNNKSEKIGLGQIMFFLQVSNCLHF